MSVKKLCEQNQEHRYEIVEAREKILALEQKIKANEKVIWKECEHEWEWDTASGYMNAIVIIVNTVNYGVIIICINK